MLRPGLDTVTQDESTKFEMRPSETSHDVAELRNDLQLDSSFNDHHLFKNSILEDESEEQPCTDSRHQVNKTYISETNLSARPNSRVISITQLQQQLSLQRSTPATAILSVASAGLESARQYQSVTCRNSGSANAFKQTPVKEVPKHESKACQTSVQHRRLSPGGSILFHKSKKEPNIASSCVNNDRHHLSKPGHP